MQPTQPTQPMQPLQPMPAINSSDPGRAIIAAPGEAVYPSNANNPEAEHRGGLPYRNMVIMVSVLAVLVMTMVGGFVIWQRRGEWFEMLPKLSSKKGGGSMGNLLQGATAVRE